MISLKKLFHLTPKSGDGLTQGQREAIIDLLNYCTYADHDIADSEEVAIDDLEYQLDWDHNIDFDYYVNKSVGVVRSAIEDKDSPGDFLKGIRARLDSKKSRQIALDLSDKLFKA
ncbi:MAG TPA: hypothetical protein VMI53_11510, partial [Opitutaceae bacterium]|nr:hypothetical protein [Opitutaceae bacterium]